MKCQCHTTDIVLISIFLNIFRFFCTLPASFQNNAMNHEYFSTKQLNGNLITFLQARAWFDFYLLPFIHFSVTFQMSACLECLHIFSFHENFSNSTQDTHLFLFLIKLHAIHPLVSRLLVKINIFTFAFTFTSVFTGFDNVPTKFIYKINSKLKSSPEYELLRRFDHIHYQPISYPCELSNIALYYFIYILKRRIVQNC